MNSKGEAKIQKILEENNIYFETQKTFKDCKDQGNLKFDFYLPNYNCCIEYDGIQHFENKSNGYFTEEKLKGIKKRDSIKNH